MIKNKSGIYKIENLINGKVYVGSALNVRVRKNNHFSDLRNKKHSSTHLQNAFNKYGENNFEFVVLEYISEDQLEEKETRWIKELKANNRQHGYNARVYVTNNKGFRQPEESKKKISINRMGKGTGKRNHSEETRKLKSDLCKAQNLKQYHTPEIEQKRIENARKAWIGKSLTEEHIEAIQKKNRGSGNGMAKLTEEDVREIKKLLKGPNISQTKMAEMFNVSTRTIRAIRSGQRWGHIE